MKEVGVNGVQDSAVLGVLIERFEGFQAGPFANDTNGEVLELLRRALALNNKRTQDRIDRAVEGTSVA